MENSLHTDSLFQRAVAEIDAGNEQALKQLLTQHAGLACTRLGSPGPWLRDKTGNAVDGFFKQPYLLWFVAEDPVRNRTLPKNIAAITTIIIDAAKQQDKCNLQQQLDYALRLVAWSRVAQDCHVQIELIDVLIDAGALPDAVNDALVNGHFAAAEHLVKRGGKLSLASAICLGHWDEVPGLAEEADAAHKQFSLVLAALNGKAEAVRKMISLGADVNAPSDDLFSHATPMHHAAGSGSLESVRILVEAGASLNAIDTVYNGTPLGWAQHCWNSSKREEFNHIIRYLSDKSRQEKTGK